MISTTTSMSTSAGKQRGDLAESTAFSKKNYLQLGKILQNCFCNRKKNSRTKQTEISPLIPGIKKTQVCDRGLRSSAICEAGKLVYI
jgi:hypothetical protein